MKKKIIRTCMVLFLIFIVLCSCDTKTTTSSELTLMIFTDHAEETYLFKLDKNRVLYGARGTRTCDDITQVTIDVYDEKNEKKLSEIEYREVIELADRIPQEAYDDYGFAFGGWIVHLLYNNKMLSYVTVPYREINEVEALLDKIISLSPIKTELPYGEN